MHRAFSACAFPLLKAGNSMPARIAMMAITTRSSINVNPRGRDSGILIGAWVLMASSLAQFSRLKMEILPECDG
jgi:hypothetical protein